MINVTTSRHTFAATASLSTALLLGLLALKVISPHLPSQGLAGWLHEAIEVCRGRDIAPDRYSRAENGGYYERLLSGSHEGRDRSLLERVLKGKYVPPFDPYIRGGFLVYRPKPSINQATIEDGNFETNSHGMIDREYSEIKPKGTFRIALLGDSIVRGRGLPNPNEERFEALLEKRLNDNLPSDQIKHVEILNFSVSGYRPTQMYYVATEIAPKFQPDMYLMSVTPLGLAPSAGAHLGTLGTQGIDPRYDFMRETLKAARVTRSDSYGEALLKVAPYRLALLRDVLVHLKAQAAAQGAAFGVLLLPGTEVPRVTKTRFEGIPEFIENTGVPTIDIRDTFDHVSDIESMRLYWSDVHPNIAGHQLLADNFYRKLQAQPALWSVLTRTETPSGSQTAITASAKTETDHRSVSR